MNHNAKRPREESEAKLPDTSPSNGSRPFTAGSTSPLLRSTSVRLLQPTLRRRVRPERPDPDKSITLEQCPARVATRPDGHTSTTIPDTDMRPEADADIDLREDADLLNEVIMAVDMRERGNVGCCYYVAKNQQIALLSDVQGGGLEVIDTCIDSCW